MGKDMGKDMGKTIPAVAERADFGPAYDGEDFVTITFRVPKETGVVPGIWDLTPRCPGTLDWAETKNDAAEARRIDGGHTRSHGR